jgi:cell division transport system ATP-binding protein
VIDFRAVEKRYDVGAIGLDQATFSVQRGEFVFLVGSTGSGKSTIMRLLIKELEPSGGAISVAGRDLSEITRRRVPYFRRNLGVVFQDFKLLPNRTVYDNVAYALQVHNYPDQLSGGEQQRVAIARAFVNHPPLLLADEPTGNLDPETSIGIMQLLYRINRTGTTVLVATHDHGMVDKMRRRVIELSRGRIVRDEATGAYARDESTREFAARMREDTPVAPETMAVEARRITTHRAAAAARAAAEDAPRAQSKPEPDPATAQPTPAAAPTRSHS